MYLVQVIVEHPVRHRDMTFGYASAAFVAPGVRVHVPFGSQQLVGLVLACRYEALSLEKLCERDGISYRYLTDIIDDKPVIKDELMQLAQWLSKTTLTSLATCFKTVLPPSLKPTSKAKRTAKTLKKIVFVSRDMPLTTRQQLYLTHLEESGGEYVKDAAVSASLRDALVAKGAAAYVWENVSRLPARKPSTQPVPELTEEQQACLEELFAAGAEKPFLLYGVTGSGKTEVYLHAAKRVIAANRQVLMLVPEISLTPALAALFISRFGAQVVILHSRLTGGEREDAYRAIMDGRVRIVVGARSAIFAPLDDIGLIILDEEHDSSYKQDHAPCYHTRDIALWRARYHHSRLILGSASPALESFARARKGSYHLLQLTKRVHDVPLARPVIIDMAKEGRLALFSEPFIQALKNCLDGGKQAIILVNRRGFSRYVICQECGYVPKCPRCDVALTYHRSSQELKCHYCNYEIPFTGSCPSCHCELVSYRGIGTQQVEENLKNHFKKLRVIRYDRDTTAKKGEHERLLNAFARHEADVLLGTQMIAKGLDFPDVTFVGVIDADSSLNFPDYRSAERTFQLLLQVSGRAGRHGQDGQAVIQTYNPDHYAIVAGARQDYLDFYKQEMQIRQKTCYPPFCYLCQLVFSGRNEQAVQKRAQVIGAVLKKYKELEVLGPAPALVAKMNNVYRWRILLKYKKANIVSQILSEIITEDVSSVNIAVDINPYSQ